MTRAHLRRASGRRFQALGLALSLGAVFGASGLIGLRPAEDAQEASCTAAVEAEAGPDIGAPLAPPEILSVDSAPIVTSGGHSARDHRL